MRRLLVVLVTAVLLVACRDVTAGKVIEKSDELAWTQFVQTCTAFDPRTGACDFYTFVPIYWPEQWDLKLEDQTQPIGHRDTSWIQVSKQDFDKYQVGDHYP